MDGVDATAEEIQEFREIFNLVDLDHGGTIDLEELRELMDLLGMEATEDEMSAMAEHTEETRGSRLSGLVSILVSWLQVLSALTVTYKMAWPPDFATYVSTLFGL